ncbi:hypothetical protein K470DRAFT_223788 [Piedraia hortae CBS 480.64]|uniref:UBZ4-type domain-containing protein n=1 Tax=Piedraia hortae CBS 480.64 TaxID=1314780 RepID=A0A6A7BPD3_9PEZI|nr:hypothetical protein K470DRAFT_223788 [Piedraia hortae CBS 480.64]
MNRPRNRQPRRNGNSNTVGARHGDRTPIRHPASPAPIQPPTISQVLPGRHVSIILKCDQLTGRQVQGIVQDVLTRGNHPRGIKVRLRDGRVGRVQGMVDTSTNSSADNTLVAGPSDSPVNRARAGRIESDVRDYYDLDHSRPPERSLADFFPTTGKTGTEEDVVVACPVCLTFKGDEYAVARHVEEHFE